MTGARVYAFWTRCGQLVLAALGHRSQERFNRVDQALERLEHKVDALTRQGSEVTMTLEELQTQVEQTREVQASAVTLIEGLATKLDEIKDDPEQIAALAASLRESTDSLAAAVAANSEAPPAE